ncbi:hypothetical protein AVEN_78797-1, partial [Araneus ventricosus]
MITERRNELEQRFPTCGPVG